MIFSCSNPVLWLYLWGFTAFGAGLFLMNGISRTKRICNDKACYDLIKQNNHTGVCHNAQLLIANYLARGFTYGRIGKELLFPCPRTANNDIEVYQAILEYYYYLDTGDYRSAGQALDKIRISQSNSKEISDLVKAEQIYGKLMLFFILGETPVKALTDCDWNKYIKKGDVQALRVKAVIDAYTEYQAGYIDNALDILHRAVKSIEASKYVYEGERIFCIRQLEQVIGIIINRKYSKNLI